jgi:hypothetical protein
MRGMGLALAVAALTCVSVSPAVAKSSFGTRYYGSATGGNGFQQYGSAVTIQVPRAANHTVDSNEIDLERAVVQGDFGASPSLMQAGLYRSGTGSNLDNCPQSVNEYRYYDEYKVAGSNSYRCGTYDVAPALEVDLFAVYASPNQGPGDWTWDMGLPGGGGFGVEAIGGSTAIPMVGEELNNNTGNPCQASSSTVAGFYAYPASQTSLDNAWYVYFATNGANPKPITSPGNTNLLLATNPNLWSIPNVPYNTTSISHTGNTNCDTNQDG